MMGMAQRIQQSLQQNVRVAKTNRSGAAVKRGLSNDHAHQESIARAGQASLTQVGPGGWRPQATVRGEQGMPPAASVPTAKESGAVESAVGRPSHFIRGVAVQMASAAVTSAGGLVRGISSPANSTWRKKKPPVDNPTRSMSHKLGLGAIVMQSKNRGMAVPSATQVSWEEQSSAAQASWEAAPTAVQASWGVAPMAAPVNWEVERPSDGLKATGEPLRRWGNAPETLLQALEEELRVSGRRYCGIEGMGG